MVKQIEPNERTNLILRVGRRIPFSGFLCALLAGISFVRSKIFIKMVPTVHPTVNVTIRGFIIMMFYGSISMSKGLKMTGQNRSEFWGLCGRGFFGFLVSATSYTALWRIPLGDSVTLLLTATVFTSILARIFLGEKFNVVNVFCVILTMLGVILIAQPPFLYSILDHLGLSHTKLNTEYDLDKLIGIILTLIAAVSFAFSYVILRALRGVHVDLIVTYFGIFNFATLLLLPLIKPFVNHPETVRMPNSFDEWKFCLGMTLCGMLGEFFLTSAFQLEKANYIAILRSGDIIIAFVAESLFLEAEWREVTWVTLLGAAFILFSVVLTTAYKMIIEKNPDSESTNSKEEQIIPALKC